MSTAALARKDRFFHETWLGMVQPAEGLVLSVPTLVDAQIVPKQTADLQKKLLERVADVTLPKGGKTSRIADLQRFLAEVLGWDERVLMPEAELPEVLRLWVPEGHQELRPTYALREAAHDPEAPRAKDRGPADTDAAKAGADLLLLVWQLPQGLALDTPEVETGEWRYPPARKLERLLRHCHVPLGLLSNGEELRLLYAPHGESLGSITFRVPDMVQTGGRPILDALVMLLSADSLFGVQPERALPALCIQSRARQADVTEVLAKQVFEALTLLLEGFEAAAARGSDADRKALADALAAEDNHLYGGLLAVLLRLVFTLYAEDNGILPTDDDIYAEHLSVLGLFAQLRDDAGAYPDSMDRRFGAWPRLLALFRAIHGGLAHGEGLNLPPRRGRLFDPDAYPFLEGRSLKEAAQVDEQQRIVAEPPRVDDGTVHQVLERLLVLEGQRLSYRALDVEQIGSVYERLMGYRVERLVGPGVYVKAGKTGAWLSTETVREVAPGDRLKWLQDQWGMDKGSATALAKALAEADTQRDGSDDALLDALETQANAQNPSGPGRKGDGRLVLQPGKERIRTSSHYTPRTLSQPIVARTLEPIVKALGDGPTAEQLLSLKLCDPAMGSGAFLVEACRWLADQVVAAWARHGELEAIGEQVDEPTIHARRLVAQRCLYGVDKNRFAVDLARMSLWLGTLAKDEPFTFVDHALRHGDSLVGLDVDAIRRFDWDPERKGSKQLDFFYKGLDGAILKALAKRQEILELAREEGAGMTEQKESLLGAAEQAMLVPRIVGDVLVGAWFAHEKDKAKDEERRRRLKVVSEWLEEDEPNVRVPAEVQEWVDEIRAQMPVFHWHLEFPEIFHESRPDPLEGDKLNAVAKMDAFVGNPPFMGGRRIRSMIGDQYTEWLANCHDSGMNADLSAHFFRRADALLGEHGVIGFVATKTIAQGDTRVAALQTLLSAGLRIFRAAKDIPWPGEAAVIISVVHLAKGRIGQGLSATLDDVPVSEINSRLAAGPERREAEPLSANLQKSFQGAVVVGLGFILTQEERDALIAKNPVNAARIFPYLGGQELNSDPQQSHSRYVINFDDLALEETEQWPDLIERVRRLVKPERDKVRRDAHRKYWWHFGDKRPALFAALAPLRRCLVVARITKHLAVSWQSTGIVFNEKVVVFPTEHDAIFSVLQSRLHDSWARLLSGERGSTLQYAPTDCFETFAFPSDATLQPGSPLDCAGKALNDARAKYCIDRNQGLTDTYNDLKDPENTDPEVVALRELHLAVDRAVIEAYGWQHVQVPVGDGTTINLIDAIPPYTTPVTDDEERAHQRFEDAVIDQLFALNAERAAEERRAAEAATKKPASKASGATTTAAKKTTRAKKTPAKDQGGLDL